MHYYYSVIFAEGGWDDDLDEPRVGGRCLCGCATMDEAVATARAWAARIAWTRSHPWLAWLLGWDGYGFGEVVVTGPSHRYVGAYGPETRDAGPSRVARWLSKPLGPLARRR